MPNVERNHWRDEWISERHRLWGIALPMVDIDFLCVEAKFTDPIAIIDYKHVYLFGKVDLRAESPTKILGNLATRAAIPAFIVFYNPETIRFRIIWLNDIAKQINYKREFISEEEYVDFLHRIRGYECKPILSVEEKQK